MDGRGEPQAPPRVLTEVIDFTIERQRHRRFVGREDVLAQLDEWLLGPGESGWVVITGGPGMGKSAVLATWLARREAAGAVVPHHFVRRQVVDWDQPERIAASIAAQIEAVFPDLCDPEAMPEGRLIELLGRVSKRGHPAKDLVVLVDGLDETRAEQGDNPLPRFLPHEVPMGIRLLCAMRPTYPHLSWIETRSPAQRIDLDEQKWAASNAAVVRKFWEAVATEYKPPLSAETKSTAIERADGNVLHAVLLHDALRALPAPERRANRIPRGLRGLIGDIWNRATTDASVRTGLGLLCAAQEALSLDILGELAGWSYNERERFVPSARQLLLEEPVSWTGTEAYRLRHEWVRELIAERLGISTLRAHHETLAQELATWPPPTTSAARRYALRHALIHRVEAGAWEEAWRLAADLGFLETKCRELDVHEAEADVARTGERCGASGAETLRRRFDDLARALGRESHWLRAAPDATAALVWNRLRQSGWDAEEIDGQLRVPDGKTFLRVRHLATRESLAFVRDLVGHADIVTACVVTPDGQYVVSASWDQTLKLWDLASGRAIGTLQGHGAWVTACAVTPDGQRMISASDDQTLKIWDLASLRNVGTLAGHGAKVNACAVTLDGQRVISASSDKTLKVWDLASLREVGTLAGHTAGVTSCAVTPDGQRVISASYDKTLKVWDLASLCEVGTLAGHTDLVTTCAVTPDGQRAVSASSDETLKVWDLASLREVRTLTGHAAWVTACAATPDSQRVVSASWDNTLKIWDLASLREVGTLAGHGDRVAACAVTPDGQRVVSASWDATLKVWDLVSLGKVGRPVGHTDMVNACTVTPDGRYMVSTSGDHTLKVWRLASLREFGMLAGHADRVNTCAVTPNSQCVVSASDDHTLKIWDLASLREVGTLAGHADRVNACAVTPDGQCVVSASDDHTLKIWDLASLREVGTLVGHGTRVTACAVTPDGQCAVSASDDRSLKIWDLESLCEVGTLAGHADRVTACTVTPDGQHVVSASWDKTLKVWNLTSLREVKTLGGHVDIVTACAVTPDGRCVVSASWDNTLKVWDLEVGTCLLTHRANSSCTAVAATKSTIIAGDAAGTVWFLEWPFQGLHERSSPDELCATSDLPLSSDTRGVADAPKQTTFPARRKPEAGQSGNGDTRSLSRMSHPIFDSLAYPWHRDDAMAAYRALQAAYPQHPDIDLVYRRCAADLPGLSMYVSPAAIWKQALEALATARALPRLCEIVCSDQAAEAAHSALRQMAAAGLERTSTSGTDDAVRPSARHAIAPAALVSQSISLKPWSDQTQIEFEHAVRRSFSYFEEALASTIPGSTGFTEVPTQRIPLLLMKLDEYRQASMLWWTCDRGDLEVRRIERFRNFWLVNKYEVDLNGAWILRAEPHWSVVVLRGGAMPSMGLRSDATTVRETKELPRDYGAWFQDRYITSEEYDDGYAEIDGNVTPLGNEADRRIRVLHEWYFFLHPKMNALGPWSREADDLRVELGKLWQQRPPKREDFERVSALPKSKF